MDKRIKNRYCVAITGTSGSGKSTVLKILKEKKYKVFDTDELSRDVISNSQIVLMYLEQLIGSHIIENGKLNFKTVGLFFEKNPSLENEFETWYQKFLGNKIIEIIAQLNESSIYFFDIPFLDKKGISNYFDEIWLIKTDILVCCNRIKKRNNYPDNKIQFLIERSKIDLDRLNHSYKIIDNNSSIKLLGQHRTKPFKNKAYPKRDIPLPSGFARRTLSS